MKVKFVLSMLIYTNTKWTKEKKKKYLQHANLLMFIHMTLQQNLYDYAWRIYSLYQLLRSFTQWPQSPRGYLGRVFYPVDLICPVIGINLRWREFTNIYLENLELCLQSAYCSVNVERKLCMVSLCILYFFNFIFCIYLA